MDKMENLMTNRDRVKLETNENQQRNQQDLRAISKNYKEENKMNNYYRNVNNLSDLSQENTRLNREFDQLVDGQL